MELVVFSSRSQFQTVHWQFHGTATARAFLEKAVKIYQIELKPGVVSLLFFANEFGSRKKKSTPEKVAVTMRRNLALMDDCAK